MKALVVNALGHGFNLEDIEIAAPMGREVLIDVQASGLCHTDLLFATHDIVPMPAVLGHEVSGIVAEIGADVNQFRVGDHVVGSLAQSCGGCARCQTGRSFQCQHPEATLRRPTDAPRLSRHGVGLFQGLGLGGFAERVRCHWSWALPLPEALDSKSAGPLFCGGLTVFSPIVEFDIRPTDRVGVVGIGGLGHMALKFLHAWGCDVTAFTSSASKADEARGFGAHHVVASNDAKALKQIAGTLDVILVTVNVTLNWNAMLAALAPRGRLHFVGAVLEPVPVPAFALIGGRKSVSGSPLGSPATAATMLEFCARHAISPQVEMFPMSRINDALDHLRAGKARYRVVLENDFR